LDSLHQLEEDPGNPESRRVVAEAIDRRAASTPDFERELREVIAEARDAGIQVDTICQMAGGDQNVQVADIADSEITVSVGQSPKQSDPPSNA
jgi:hypothetical protein